MKDWWDEVVGIVSEGEAEELNAEYGGRLIRDDIFEKIVASDIKPLSIGFGIRRRLKPLTRRQKLQLRVAGIRWRVVTAIEVLRGQHECDGSWD